MSTRADPHQLVDALPDASIEGTARLLRLLHADGDRLPPFLRDASVDDDPLSEDERVALAEGLADIAAGATTSQERLERELGR